MSHSHYVLHVEGYGPHDSTAVDGDPAAEHDADAHLQQLVQALSEAGHTIYAATLHVGAGRELIKHHDGELHYEHRPANQ